MTYLAQNNSLSSQNLLTLFMDFIHNLLLVGLLSFQRSI